MNPPQKQFSLNRAASRKQFPISSFTGIPGHPLPHIALDAEFIMRNMVLKNQVLVGSVNAGRDAFDNAIHDLSIFMTRWPDAVRALITGRHQLDKAKELLIGKATGIKNVLTFS